MAAIYMLNRDALRRFSLKKSDLVVQCTKAIIQQFPKEQLVFNLTNRLLTPKGSKSKVALEFYGPNVNGVAKGTRIYLGSSIVYKYKGPGF